MAIEQASVSLQSEQRPTAAYALAVVAITMIAFGLRLGCTAWLQGLNAPPKKEANPDQVDYEAFAWRLVSGRGYSLESGAPTAVRPPGTSFILVPVYAIFGRSYLAARLWFCLLSALTCAATAWAARPSFGARVALVAAALLAVYPGHFYYAMHFLSEAPFALWLILAIGCALRALAGRRRLLFAVLAGVCWGFAVLTRPHLLLAGPIAAALIVFAPAGKKRPYAASLAIMAAFLIITVAPWVVRNALVLGKATLNTANGGFTFWGANNEVVLNDPALRGSWIPLKRLLDAEHELGSDELERDNRAYAFAWTFIRTHWQRMPELCCYKVWRLITPFPDTENRATYWAFALGWLALGPLVVVGSALAFRQDRLATIVFWMPIVTTVGTTVVFYGSERFRDSLAPVFTTLAAVAVVRALPRVS
jgi:4-amino-4-deoxy-L-arabinose transferase-like glycosyltransferase